jgi:hypothetical protein
VIVDPGCDSQTSCLGGQRTHRVDSVFDKVQEYLLELRSIQVHLGKVVLKFRHDRYIVYFEIVLQQSQCEQGNAVDACQRSPARRFFRQLANARNDCTRPMAFGLYVSQDVVNFLQLGRI